MVYFMTWRTISNNLGLVALQSHGRTKGHSLTHTFMNDNTVCRVATGFARVCLCGTFMKLIFFCYWFPVAYLANSWSFCRQVQVLLPSRQMGQHLFVTNNREGTGETGGKEENKGPIGTNQGLFRKWCSVKTVADCQGSSKVFRQLQTVKTVTDFQGSSKVFRQLQTVKTVAYI